MGFGLVIRCIDHLQIVTKVITELHTANITVTTAHLKPSLSSVVISC
jgi:hypothetical protein